MRRTFTVLVVICLLLCTACGSPEQTAPQSTKPASEPTESATPAEPAEPAEPATPETVSAELEFSAGNYIAGIDFPAGKYDIDALSGTGNVMSDNMFNGGINAVMGPQEENDAMGTDLYESSYANIKLPEGTTLRVSGSLTIKIASDDASGAPLKDRSQPNTETVDIGSGNFVAGEDFPAGVYDVVVVSGSGNVMSDNMMDGGINEVMGINDGTFDYLQQFKNLDLPEGTTLTVSGVKIQLVPSV